MTDNRLQDDDPIEDFINNGKDDDICPQCDGTGTDDEGHLCKECQGKGHINP